MRLLIFVRFFSPVEKVGLGHGHGNKRRGLVPINDILRPHLDEAKEARTCGCAIEWRSENVSSIKTGFSAAAKGAGLHDISPHVLRHTAVTHTAVTWMVMAGVPMRMVARYAAMSEEMVEKRYWHHSPEYLRQAAEALAG